MKNGHCKDKYTFIIFTLGMSTFGSCNSLKIIPIYLGTKTRPARVRRISGNRFRIILQEGRNRQIRRMVHKVGSQVTRLNRIRVGNVKLGRLLPGSWRHLTDKETRNLVKETLK